MATICRGTVAQPRLALLLFIPAIVFMLLGVTIVVEPRILVWLIAVILVLVGTGILLGAITLHRVVAKMREQRG